MPSNITCIRTPTQRAWLARTGVGGGVLLGSWNTLYIKNVYKNVGVAALSAFVMSLYVEQKRCAKLGSADRNLHPLLFSQ